MKKFLSLFLVLFSAGMAFVVGDYLGARAQKDHDSLEIADLHQALVKSVEQFDACKAQKDFLGNTFLSTHIDYNGLYSTSARTSGSKSTARKKD